MNNVKEKKKLKKVDVVILILLLLCLIGIALRVFVIVSQPEEYTDPDTVAKEYYISYIVSDQFYTTKDYLAENTEFRFYETNSVFGVTIGTPIVTNASKWYSNIDGEYVEVINNAEEKLSDNPFAQSIAAKYDIKGKMLVKGKYTDGVFVIEGSEKENIALNTPVELRSDCLKLEIYITEITPVEQ